MRTGNVESILFRNKPWLISTFVITVAVWLASPDCALAATIISEENNDYIEISIYGEIERGDAAKFISLVQNSNVEKPVDLSIFSPGGDLIEAMRIGRFVREYLIPTGAPDEVQCMHALEGRTRVGFNKKAWPKDVERSNACTCYSACFVIWSAGAWRAGGFAPMKSSSQLGIHRPRFAAHYFANLSAREADDVYDQLVQEFLMYLRDMDVPESIIEQMITVASNDIYLLSEEELDSMTPMIPSIDEWLLSKCGELLPSQQETRDYDEMTRRWEGLSGPEKNYLESINKKMSAARECRESNYEQEQIDRLRSFRGE